MVGAWGAGVDEGLEAEEDSAGLEGGVAVGDEEGEAAGVGGVAGEVVLFVVELGDDGGAGLHDGLGAIEEGHLELFAHGELEGGGALGDVRAGHPEGEGLDGGVGGVGDFAEGDVRAGEVVDDLGDDVFGRVEVEGGELGRFVAGSMGAAA